MNLCKERAQIAVQCKVHKKNYLKEFRQQNFNRTPQNLKRP